MNESLKKYISTFGIAMMFSCGALGLEANEAEAKVRSSKISSSFSSSFSGNNAVINAVILNNIVNPSIVNGDLELDVNLSDYRRIESSFNRYLDYSFSSNSRIEQHLVGKDVKQVSFEDINNQITRVKNLSNVVELSKGTMEDIADDIDDVMENHTDSIASQKDRQIRYLEEFDKYYKEYFGQDYSPEIKSTDTDDMTYLKGVRNIISGDIAYNYINGNTEQAVFNIGNEAMFPLYENALDNNNFEEIKHLTDVGFKIMNTDDFKDLADKLVDGDIGIDVFKTIINASHDNKDGLINIINVLNDEKPTEQTVKALDIIHPYAQDLTGADQKNLFDMYEIARDKGDLKTVKIAFDSGLDLSRFMGHVTHLKDFAEELVDGDISLEFFEIVANGKGTNKNNHIDAAEVLNNARRNDENSGNIDKALKTLEPHLQDLKGADSEKLYNLYEKALEKNDVNELKRVFKGGLNLTQIPGFSSPINDLVDKIVDNSLDMEAFKVIVDANAKHKEEIRELGETLKGEKKGFFIKEDAKQRLDEAIKIVNPHTIQELSMVDLNVIAAKMGKGSIG